MSDPLKPSIKEDKLEDKIILLNTLLKDLDEKEAINYLDAILKPIVSYDQTADKSYLKLADKFIDLSIDLSQTKNIEYADVSNKKFNKMGIYYSFKSQFNQIKFFFNKLVPQQKDQDPSKTFFTPKSNPHENQMAYFNLGYGYPKEMFGGHFCYILKELKTKYLVIPSTSVKEDDSKLGDFEIDIKIKDFENDLKTRLQVSDIRTVDKLRLKLNERIYDLETDSNYINTEIKKILNLS